MPCSAKKDCDFYNIVSPFVTGKIKNAEQTAMIEQYRSKACGKEAFDGNGCPFYGFKVCEKYPTQPEKKPTCKTLSGRMNPIFLDTLLGTSLNACLLGNSSCMDRLSHLVEDPEANAPEIAAGLYGVRLQPQK